MAIDRAFVDADLLNLLLRGLDLEIETEPGRVNALLIVVSAIVLVVVAVPSLPELIIGIWVPGYSPDVPVVPVVAILLGGGLICVLLLVLVEPLLQRRRKDDD
jgi:hypothetical protein